MNLVGKRKCRTMAFIVAKFRVIIHHEPFIACNYFLIKLAERLPKQALWL